ncbi:hypothetical protein KGF54_003433 [Candida jiufengensis]|uniref:uncharacterized protein n=1 Tax=Candida jiufengensis TaxID=497108 RepID=UPI002224F453|nr:uncharacterized protein KGF54_003433 [Candida jiufengensis]KAI5952566.1 hypothetical protein KGF54_003433 [Candida jiufengensis]
MSYTKTQEISRKRLRTQHAQPQTLKKIKTSSSTPAKPEIIQTISEITFNKRSQSVLSLTQLSEPLKIQSEYPIPELNEYEILVSNKAIGLNPIDWKGKKYGFVTHVPRIDGRESSGEIVKLGNKVKNFKVGDKVIVSSTSYRDNRTSTFQQFTAIDSRLVWKLPDNFSFEDGATIGVGLVTAGILLYNSFGFELNLEPKVKINETILIWGGATIVGIYLAQLAKLHGLKVISIASTTHEKYLKNIGVDHLINRHQSDEEILKKIEEGLNGGSINYSVDCVSKETAQKVLDILEKINKPTDNKTKFSGIVGVPKQIPDSIELKEVIIKRFHEDKEFGSSFIKITSTFLKESKIKPTRYKQYKGGLEIIDDALNDLEKNGANGEKYVVSIN